MSEADEAPEIAAFLAQFTDVKDESILSEAEKQYVATHRKGSLPKGKLGWKADGSLNLYDVNDFGPICAMIRLPTDPAALAKLEAEQQAFIEKARKVKAP
jgi:hypothetical protein